MKQVERPRGTGWLFVISNRAFPGKVLYPFDQGEAMSRIALGDAGVGEHVGVHGETNTWRVRSPLIDAALVMKN